MEVDSDSVEVDSNSVEVATDSVEVATDLVEVDSNSVEVDSDLIQTGKRPLGAFYRGRRGKEARRLLRQGNPEGSPGSPRILYYLDSPPGKSFPGRYFSV
jgi:hypothetical protein